MIRSYWIVRSKEEGNSGEANTLREAAKKAEEQVNAANAENKEIEQEQEGEAEEEESEQSEDDLTDADKKEGENLIRLLRNPQTAKATVEFLMKSSGITVTAETTKKEESAAVKTIKAQIVEGLGEKYAFFADKLGETIQGVLEKAIEDKTKDIREKQQKDEEERITDKIAAAQRHVVEKYIDVPKKVLQEVMRIQTEGEVRPGPKANHESFFEVCLEMAAKNLDHKLTRKSSTSTTTTRKTNPANNLGDRGGERNEAKPVAQQSKSFKDAVNQAVQQVQAKLAKN